MAKQTKISLSVDQIQAINSILGGKSKEEAAREADVHVDKIEDWLETDAPFIANLNKKRKNLYHEQTERLRSMANDAIDALQDLLNSENESVRLRAASLVLKTAGYSELGKPQGSTTVNAVKADRKRQEMFNSLASF